MKDQDVQLAGQIYEMNHAAGDKKLDLMAVIVTRMAAQRTEMNARMETMHEAMVKNIQMDQESMPSDPMTQGIDTDSMDDGKPMKQAAMMAEMKAQERSTLQADHDNEQRPDGQKDGTDGCRAYPNGRAAKDRLPAHGKYAGRNDATAADGQGTDLTGFDDEGHELKISEGWTRLRSAQPACKVKFSPNEMALHEHRSKSHLHLPDAHRGAIRSSGELPKVQHDVGAGTGFVNHHDVVPMELDSLLNRQAT